MSSHPKLGVVAAFVLSLAVTVSAPVFAGDPHAFERWLEQSRAAALRAQCKDAEGRCIQHMMQAGNDAYKCRMRDRGQSETSRTTREGVREMFC